MIKIELRELSTLEELEEIQDLERQTWETDIVPTHQTLTSVKNGGIIIGAYRNGVLIGFSYGFPGFIDGEVYLCSHMLAIDEAYRSLGIGEKLKLKQREIAIEKGYDRIIWTFDPLETRNAYLNLTKLRGICHTYIENCYGEMKDGLNKGLPSDRFELHWHLLSPHVMEKKRFEFHDPIPLNKLHINKKELPVFVSNEVIEFTKEEYTLLVPKDFQRLKNIDPNLAMDWRLKTRQEFMRIFEAGYTAVELRVFPTFAAYLFVKNERIEFGGIDR